MAAGRGPLQPFQALHRFCPWDGTVYGDAAASCHACGGPRLAGSEGLELRPPWRKVLYSRQAYPDNHTDASFLSSMVTNANAVERKYWAVVRGSLIVAHQISTVGAIGVVSALSLGAEHGGVVTGYLLGLDATLLVFGSVGLLFTDRDLLFPRKFGSGVQENLAKGRMSPPGSPLTKDEDPPWAPLGRKFFLCVLFFGGIFILSPILQTLTRSISSDTIYATTIFLLLVHLLFHDYSYAHAITSKFTGNLSLMSAIFSSVLIASRLDSQVSVFALISFCLELFVLFPVIWHRVREVSTRLHLLFSFLTILPTAGLLYMTNVGLFCLFLVVIFMVTLVCPYWLIRINKYKFEIHGPWDEAKLIIPTA